jgi:hypothetical protein
MTDVYWTDLPGECWYGQDIYGDCVILTGKTSMYQLYAVIDEDGSIRGDLELYESQAKRRVEVGYGVRYEVFGSDSPGVSQAVLNFFLDQIDDLKSEIDDLKESINRVKSGLQDACE